MEQLLTERLCRLLGTFDECEISVLPYEPDGVGARVLWLVPGEVRRESVFVSGSCFEIRRYTLKLKHRSITSEDKLNASKILESVAQFGRSNIGDGMTICLSGDVRLESTKGEIGIFSLALDVGSTVLYGTADERVKYYFSPDGVGRFYVGIGVTSFVRRTEARLWSRRFIHEDFVRSVHLDNGVSYDFSFRTDYDECALLPLLGECTDIQVLMSREDGSAELLPCVLSNAELDGVICRGTLSARSAPVFGSFDRNSGIFEVDS